MITKTYLYNVLKKNGYLLNKNALFDYMNFETDLITLKFKDVCDNILYSENKRCFYLLKWEDILIRLNGGLLK